MVIVGARSRRNGLEGSGASGPAFSDMIAVGAIRYRVWHAASTKH